MVPMLMLLCHQQKTGWWGHDFVILYLNKKVKNHENEKIVIIWDNASCHKSALVKEFLAETTYDFYFINFPPYSPELNPQEHVWKQGRSEITHNNFIENIDKATDAFVEHLNSTLFQYKFL